MKTTIKKQVLAILLGLSFAFVASAKGFVSIRPYVNSDYAVVVVDYKNDKAFRVKVVSENNEVIYSSEKLNTSELYQKLFDLTSFKDGNYRLVIGSGKNQLVESFAVRDHKLTPLQNKVENVESHIRKDGNHLYVSTINMEKAEIIFSIEDQYGSTIYSNELNPQLSYTGKYNVEQLPAGSYKAILSVGGKELDYVFKN